MDASTSTPASNTKILTLAACLEYLPDTLPAMKVINTEDRVFIRGTGNPALLHPNLRPGRRGWIRWRRWRENRNTIAYYPRHQSP
jgi:D-alanyl-D-alanine carboxypeptidase/D-alanyl-D-alanine-endopeptidase (penicillin-binding protein 4)